MNTYIFCWIPYFAALTVRRDLHYTGWAKNHAQTLSANNSAHTHLFAMRFFALNQAQFNLEFRFLLFLFRPK
jgi:hypothetical protein